MERGEHCPLGEIITTGVDCAKAALKLTVSYGGSFTSANWPAGCFWSKFVGQFRAQFNTITDPFAATPEGPGGGICKKTSTITYDFSR